MIDRPNVSFFIVFSRIRLFFTTFTEMGFFIHSILMNDFFFTAFTEMVVFFTPFTEMGFFPQRIPKWVLLQGFPQ